LVAVAQSWRDFYRKSQWEAVARRPGFAVAGYNDTSRDGGQLLGRSRICRSRTKEDEPQEPAGTIDANKAGRLTANGSVGHLCRNLRTDFATPLAVNLFEQSPTSGDLRFEIAPHVIPNAFRSRGGEGGDGQPTVGRYAGDTHNRSRSLIDVKSYFDAFGGWNAQTSEVEILHLIWCLGNIEGPIGSSRQFGNLISLVNRRRIFVLGINRFVELICRIDLWAVTALLAASEHRALQVSLRSADASRH
jgi:hypothetical protein